MTDRLLHQCSYPGCDTQARFTVMRHIPCPTGHAATKALVFESTLKVCHAHRAKVAPISDKDKSTIAAKLAEEGYPAPAFDQAKIDFKPLAVDQTRVLNPIAKCDRSDCDNPAKWQVVQDFRTIGQSPGSKKRISMLTNFCLCEKHRKEAKPADLLDQESRSSAHKALNRHGVILPDFDSMTLRFVGLTLGQRVDPDTFRGEG